MSNQRLFTFRSGGWVILISAIGALSLITWAIAPAVMNMFQRPPGDGKTIESYQFDLTPLHVERDLIRPAMLHRDMWPVMNDPQLTPGSSVSEINEKRRGKVLVSSDRVIGVVLNGESRAYPLRWLNVHEVIHDTLGGIPIAVTYHWPCDAVRVFDRRVGDRVIELGISGLVYNHNALYYERESQNEKTPDDDSARSAYGESLWSQLLAHAVSGDAAGNNESLRVIPSMLTNWEDWLAAHPDTTLVMPQPRFHKVYKGAEPNEYFISDELLFPLKHEPPDAGPPAKTRIVAVEVAGKRRVYPQPLINANCGEDETWTTSFNGATLTFRYDNASRTAWLTIPNDTSAEPVAQATYAYWFAYHAMFPEATLATSAE